MSKSTKPQKTNKSSANFRRTAAFISALALIASGTLIITSCNSSSKTSESESSYSTKVETSETTVTTEPPEQPLVLLPQGEEQLKLNSDYAGWIKIDGVVDEPIVQTKDNEFYLDHDYKSKAKSDGGTIFADYRNILNTRKQSDNIVLYGHNQKNGTRFGNLDLYKWNKNYYKSKPLISFNTAYEERQYKIFSVFITNVNPEHDNGNVFDYQNYIDLKDEARFNTFVDQCKKRSLIITDDVDIKLGDKFLTLSTCSTEFEPSRLVIVAREVRDGESTEVDMTKFKVNDNPLFPAIYYKFAGGSYREN